MSHDTLPEVRTHLELWPEPLPESGSLAEVSVAMLLAQARLMRVTGVLGLRGERFVYLARGLPVFVDSVLQVDASDVYLVKAGILRERALEEIRTRAAEAGSGVGEALMQMGVVTPSELFEHKREHTKQCLVDCMGWREGTARFEERPFGPEVVQIPVDLAQVFAEGVELHYDAQRLARELPVTEVHRVYLAGPPDAARGLALGPLEARLLSRAPSRPSLAALAMDLRLDDQTFRRGLFVLYHLGLVGFELSGEERARRPRSEQPEPGPDVSGPEVIRPEMSATPRPAVAPPGRIKSPAPMPRVAPPAPPARPPRASPAPAPPERTAPPMAAAPRPPRTSPAPAPPAPLQRPPRPTPAPIAGGDDDVLDAVIPPGAGPRRKLPPLSRPTRSASGYLEDAEMARDAGNLEDALLALRYAHAVEPENPSITAELALGYLDVDDKAFARDAGRLARDARRQNPSLPLPYVVLGILMEQLRDFTRAAQLYKHALSRDPGCERANERLQRLSDRRRR